MSPCINCCPLQREASRTKVESSTDLWVYTAFTVRCDNMTIWQNNSSRFSPRAYDSPQPWTLAQVSLWIRPHSRSESMLHYGTSGHIVPGWVVLQHVRSCPGQDHWCISSPAACIAPAGTVVSQSAGKTFPDQSEIDFSMSKASVIFSNRILPRRYDEQPRAMEFFSWVGRSQVSIQFFTHCSCWLILLPTPHFPTPPSSMLNCLFPLSTFVFPLPPPLLTIPPLLRYSPSSGLFLVSQLPHMPQDKNTKD